MKILFLIGSNLILARIKDLEDKNKALEMLVSKLRDDLAKKK
jgi:hypothetical protein